MQEKKIDTALWMRNIREMIDMGEEVPLVVTGGSMLPFLAGGRDTVLLKKAPEKLQRGMIALYVRPDGSFILHRIAKCEGENLFFVGDAQTVIEGPLPSSVVFAVVTKAKRKGVIIDERSAIWKFFEKTWLDLIRYRRIIIKLYSIITRFKRKNLVKKQ